VLPASTVWEILRDAGIDPAPEETVGFSVRKLSFG
jgi:hypothetical protein